MGLAFLFCAFELLVEEEVVVDEEVLNSEMECSSNDFDNGFSAIISFLLSMDQGLLVERLEEVDGRGLLLYCWLVVAVVAVVKNRFFRNEKAFRFALEATKSSSEVLGEALVVPFTFFDFIVN